MLNFRVGRCRLIPLNYRRNGEVRLSVGVSIKGALNCLVNRANCCQCLILLAMMVNRVVHWVVNRWGRVTELIMVWMHWRGSRRGGGRNPSSPILVMAVSLWTIEWPVSHTSRRVISVISLNLRHTGRRSRIQGSNAVSIMIAVMISNITFNIWHSSISVLQVVIRSDRAAGPNWGRSRISLVWLWWFPLRKPVAAIAALLRFCNHGWYTRFQSLKTKWLTVEIFSLQPQFIRNKEKKV